MRKSEINPIDIMEAAIHLVAENGLENISTRKITSACGISEGSLFNYFKNKNELLVQCLYLIDNSIDKSLQGINLNLLSLKKSIRSLWFTYFDYLVSHKDYAKFYRQFRHSSYYNDEVIAGQDKSFAYFSGVIKKLMPSFEINMDIFWVYMIETTLNFAIRVADGQLPDSPKDREKYFSLIANGVTGVFKSAKNWDR